MLRTHCRLVLSLPAALVLALTGCDRGEPGTTATPASGSGGTASTTPPPATASGGAPSLEFAKPVFDLGVITDTTKHTLMIPFTNTGGSQLVIADIKGDCGCTSPVLRQRIFAPGQGDAIEVVFDPKGKKGPEKRTITVFSNAPQRSAKIDFTADIRPMIDFDSMHQVGTMPINEGTTRTLDFKYTDPDLEITGVRTNNPYITARIGETLDDAGTLHGQPAKQVSVMLDVAPEAPWGVLFANKLFVDVTGRPMPDAEPIEHTYEISLLGKIVGDIDADPMILSLGNLQANRDYSRSTIITRRSGETFRIIDASVGESTLPGVQTRIEELGPASYRLTVHGNIGSYSGWIRGRILVQTDVPGEELLQLPFSGLVK